MAFHRCTIYQQDGSLIAENVTVVIEEADAASGGEWYGTLTITPRVDLTAGRCYCIVLGDGRRGEFVVRRNTFAGETKRAVAIHGTSPLA